MSNIQNEIDKLQKQLDEIKMKKEEIQKLNGDTNYEYELNELNSIINNNYRT